MSFLAQTSVATCCASKDPDYAHFDLCSELDVGAVLQFRNWVAGGRNLQSFDDDEEEETSRISKSKYEQGDGMFVSFQLSLM